MADKLPNVITVDKSYDANICILILLNVSRKATHAGY